MHCAPLDADDASAAHTSRLVNALSEAIERTLSAHPINAARVAAGKNAANCVLLRGCGRRLAVPTFAERHGGISAFMIAPTCIIAGLGLSVGIHIERVDGATGDYRTDLSAKARAASAAIAHHDLGFIHVKAVDDAAHDRNIARRIEWLEKIDAQLIAPIIDTARRANERIAVIITGDHASPVIYGDHSCEPVPFVVCIDAARADDEQSEHAAMRDAIDRFDEIEAARGALGRFCGDQVMGIVRQVVAL